MQNDSNKEILLETPESPGYLAELARRLFPILGVAWVFAILFFYVLRFAVMVWRAGQAGILGL